MNFREKIGLKQLFDDWAKGINNTIQNLYKQGLDEYAKYNIDLIKAQGYKTRINNKGQEVIARSNENKKLYKDLNEADTQSAKSLIFNVKEAKAHKTLKEREDEYEDEDEDEDEEPTEDNENIYDDDIDAAADWYELSQIIADIMTKITGSDQTVFEGEDILRETKGKRTELEHYKEHAKARIEAERKYYEDLRKYDNIE